MKLKLKTYLSIGLVVLITLFLARPFIEKGINHLPSGDYSIDFVDDSGYRIRMEKPADTIISLYSAHTENLFALGLDREIIGVGTSDVYPYKALSKEVYDYKSDPEKVIAARPDVVLIRPFIERHSPDFVKSLRRTGITVVSLYPDNYDEFDDYIMKLAYLTGKESTAKRALEDFYAALEAYKSDADLIENKVGVYFESSDREYKTVTNVSMPAHAIEFAGGKNIAADAVPIEEGSSIAIYGTEKIIEKAGEIEVYVTQRGVMGAGGNTHSISIRPGFDVIKAVKNDRVLEINQKIISSPTFRFIKGIHELRRAFYPEIYDKLVWPETITRASLSDILISYKHEPIFVPTASYYRDENKEHYYGAFEDVTLDHDYFDVIETAMQKGYFHNEIIDEVEYFYPEKTVSREEFAMILYLINDFKNEDFKINDLEACENPRIIQTIVYNGLMDLENGNFNPSDAVSLDDVKKGLIHD
ncbi:ABC transporter substrate-binding protein [Acidaminobacter sp. JC074]|uniref:ABC transporter substrate-binding protein n=1 Tax=Acidaminobacter sp. JC074 TaxID=2530199 RepID=UPI001F0CF87A|nr:ABC transporter substrate-binding protein [Acidaminobacter sp. JC074]MCH4888255.1 ABC transporter substrate-binding protein [Acidaminobacter sp. JC074]